MHKQSNPLTCSNLLKNHLRKLMKIRNISNNDANTPNDLFTLWINDNHELPELQHLSLKSMLLTKHNVTLYTYHELDNVPQGINVKDANMILNESKIFKYKEGFNAGSYSGFANWFRVECLNKTGSTWFDCDILAINNINNFNFGDTVISAQYNNDGSINPNNAFLKLRKNDKLLKDMLSYMADVKDNVKHGDTGPHLLKSMMDNQYKEYYNHLTNTNFIASINFFDYEFFLKPSEDIVDKLKFNEIWGFHVWNAMFRHNKIELEKVNNCFYYDLKEAILESSSQEEYKKKIHGIRG